MWVRKYEVAGLCLCMMNLILLRTYYFLLYWSHLNSVSHKDQELDVLCCQKFRFLLELRSLCHHDHWWFVWWSHLNSVIEDQKVELCSQIIEVFVLLRSWYYYVMKARSAINYLKSTWPSHSWGSENWVRLSHYWNPVDLMLYSFVNFVTFLLSTERKCHICAQ